MLRDHPGHATSLHVFIEKGFGHKISEFVGLRRQAACVHQIASRVWLPCSWNQGLYFPSSRQSPLAHERSLSRRCANGRDSSNCICRLRLRKKNRGFFGRERILCGRNDLISWIPAIRDESTWTDMRSAMAALGLLGLGTKKRKRNEVE